MDDEKMEQKRLNEGPGDAGPAGKQPEFCTESAGKPRGRGRGVHDPSNL